MKRHKRRFDDDKMTISDDELAELARPKPTKAPATPKDPVIKQSYESNEEVQRWLQDQMIEAASKPEFEPTLLAGRRDSLWILSSLTHFYEMDLITDVIGTAKSGKEASVYCCVADPSTEYDYLAAKVYRPRMFRNLRNDAIYRQNRQQRDEQGRVVRDGRRRNSKTTRARLEQVSSWIAYEYETQKQLHAAGADVPRPLAQIGNAVLMEFIGTPEQPAPRLNEIPFDRSMAHDLFDQLIRNIELFLACDRIHGDLSAYNILYWDGRATIIDFAQAVDARTGEDVFTLLERDVERVYRYVAPYGVRADPQAIAVDMWTRYLMGALA